MSGDKKISISPSTIDFISKINLTDIPENRKMVVIQNSAQFIVDVFSAAHLYFNPSFNNDFFYNINQYYSFF